MKNIFIIIILTFCPLANLLAQDKYEVFRKEMSLIEKQENEYRKVIWGENDFSQGYKDSIYKKHQVLVKEKVEFAKNAIRENRDDERFLKVLDIYVRNFLSLDEFETELKSFSTKVQKTETCQRYFEFIKYARINVPGKQCIDFEMKGHNGETIKFSDVYKKHKLVLVDFWASWCKPCCEEMPSLKKLYRDYRAKGLEIVGISIDEDKKAWQQKVGDLGMNWIQLRDASREAVKKYVIGPIPHTVLIDPSGKIIAKDLRGQELENKIIECLK